MPEPLPEIAPWEPPKRPLYIVSDGPTAVSAGTAPPLAEDPPADAPGVTDTVPETVTDGPSAGVTDADADADGNLPAIAEFGREIGPVARFGIAATRGAGVIGSAAVKGAVKSSTWTVPPQSMAGHSAWVRGRQWIPEDVKDEPLIGFLVFLRNAWGWTAGLLFTGLGNFVNWLRLPQHFLAAAAAYLILYWLVIR